MFAKSAGLLSPEHCRIKKHFSVAKLRACLASLIICSPPFIFKLFQEGQCGDEKGNQTVAPQADFQHGPTLPIACLGCTVLIFQTLKRDRQPNPIWSWNRQANWLELFPVQGWGWLELDLSSPYPVSFGHRSTWIGAI